MFIHCPKRCTYLNITQDLKDTNKTIAKCCNVHCLNAAFDIVLRLDGDNPIPDPACPQDTIELHLSQLEEQDRFNAAMCKFDLIGNVFFVDQILSCASRRGNGEKVNCRTDQIMIHLSHIISATPTHAGTHWKPIPDQDKSEIVYQKPF